MTRIAPKDLNDAIAAARPGDRIELDGGEHAGQVVIDKPLVIEGRGVSTWLGNRTGPVLLIRCKGVELHDLQIEMTGDLQHPAILAEPECGPLLRNVAIRRGELYIAGPHLRFAPPPAVRLRELAPEEVAGAEVGAAADEGAPARRAVVARASSRSDATTLSMPPPPPSATAMAATAVRAEPLPAATVLATGATSASPHASPAAATPRTAAAATAAPRLMMQSRPLAVLRSPLGAAVGLAALALCGGVLYLLFRSTPSQPEARLPAAPMAAVAVPAATLPPRAAPASTAASEPVPPPLDELRLTSNLRTSIEVVGWSQDEERFVLEITYGRDSANPARWRVRALVDAASERVLKWQDLSEAPARVAAGEDENPPWAKDPEAIQIEDFQSGSVIEPAQLDVRWCGNKRSPRFPASAQPAGRELELTWAARGEQIAATQCRTGDFGQVLLQAKGSPWRLMRFQPWKGNTSTVRVHSSPSSRRAVVVALFRLADRSVTRFYSRLLGPQIHILSSNPDLRGEALRLLGTPGLFMSENAQAPVPGPSRLMVRADDEAALQVAAALQEKLKARFGLAEIEPVTVKAKTGRTTSKVDDSYLWGDILIVLK